MRKLLGRLKSSFLNKKFLGFCLIGIVNTFNTAFFSWLVHLKVQENISAYIGYFISLTINYILNSTLVFKSCLSLRKYLRFLISYIPNFFIYTFASVLTINVLKIEQFWATTIATAVGGPITYIIIKFFAFGNRSKAEEPDEPFSNP